MCISSFFVQISIYNLYVTYSGFYVDKHIDSSIRDTKNSKPIYLNCLETTNTQICQPIVLYSDWNTYHISSVYVIKNAVIDILSY